MLAVKKFRKLKKVLLSPGDCRKEAVALCNRFIRGYEKFDVTTPEGIAHAITQAMSDLGIKGATRAREVNLEDAICLAEKTSDEMLHTLMAHFPVDAEIVRRIQDEARSYLLEKIQKTETTQLPATLGLFAYVALNVLKSALTKDTQTDNQEPEPPQILN